MRRHLYLVLSFLLLLCSGFKTATVSSTDGKQLHVIAWASLICRRSPMTSCLVDHVTPNWAAYNVGVKDRALALTRRSRCAQSRKVLGMYLTFRMRRFTSGDNWRHSAPLYPSHRKPFTSPKLHLQRCPANAFSKFSQANCRTRCIPWRGS